jgi:hypothetical protein
VKLKNRSIFSFVVILALIPSGQRPQERSASLDTEFSKDYPPVLQFTKERYSNLLKEWKEFTREYNVNFLNPNQPYIVDSVLMIPNIGAININHWSKDTLTLDQMEHLFRDFLKKWGKLFNTSPGEPATYRSEEFLGKYQFMMRKTFSRANSFFGLIDLRTSTNFDQIEARISKTGTIEALRIDCAPDPDDRIFPRSRGQFPAARVTLPEALQTIDGRSIRWQGMFGEQTHQMNSASIASIERVLLHVPRYTSVGTGRQKSDSIEYRVCWEATDGMFTVYVDAVTGEFLDYHRQLFVE